MAVVLKILKKRGAGTKLNCLRSFIGTHRPGVVAWGMGHAARGIILQMAAVTGH